MAELLIRGQPVYVTDAAEWERRTNNSLLLFEHFFKLVGYRQFVLRTGILSWNVDGIKVVLLEKEEAQRGKGMKNSVTSKN